MPVEARMRAAIELRDAMIAMRREALRRELPKASEEEIDARLRRWVLAVEPPPSVPTEIAEPPS
jgi:hypothetical protein